jgi:hypothetical protein
MEHRTTLSRDGRRRCGRHEADARDRARATLVQGLVAGLVVAPMFALVAWVRAEQLSPVVLLASGATAGATALLTYLQRAYLDPYRRIRRTLSSPPTERHTDSHRAQTVGRH